MASSNIIPDEQLVLLIKYPYLQDRSVNIKPKVLLSSSPNLADSSKNLMASRWQCVLTPQVGLTRMSLKRLDASSDCTIPEFKFIHCIPQNDEKRQVASISDHMTSEIPLMRGGKFNALFTKDRFIDKNNPNEYAFNIVLSTTEKLPAVLVVSGDPTISEEDKTGTNKSFKKMFPDRYQDMLGLLNDPESVNVAFVFTIHSCERKVALWAHRTLLKKYPRFQELFDSKDIGPVIVPIEGISLTTFCVLLKYLYTEDLDLNVDPTQYLMCDMDHLNDKPFMDSTSSLSMLNKSLQEYNAAQFYATWNVKDKVTWADLFLAVDRFEISELRKQCLGNLLASVNQSNAMEILFGAGTCFKEVRDPVMKYILKHLKSSFSIQTQDPFKRFVDHAKCHEVMLELLRLSCAD